MSAPSSGSYRAFGASHLQWVGELQVDEVARRVGLDPLEMRRRNLLRPGEIVRRGGTPLDADLVGDVEKAAAALGWDEPLAPGRGRGLSVGLLAAGAHPVSSAIVRLESDGEAVVLVGSTEMYAVAREGLAVCWTRINSDGRLDASDLAARAQATMRETGLADV